MFENILYQDKLVASLRQEIQNKSLPQSLLFSGPRFSAKLTTALELARSLSCRQGGAWNCACEDCRLHRTLDYSYMLLSGQKNVLPEIEAGSGLLERHRSDARRYFLIRAVKKLTKRFDPVLWEGEESKLKNANTHLSQLQEEIETLYPGRDLPSDAVLSKTLTKIRESAAALSNILPASGLPIHQVRRFSAWARTTSPGNPKFVLLENADRMQDGARNALLKILEEPPANTWFILLTSQKGAMIQTVLSRLRSFVLAERTEDQEQKILQALFHCEEKSYTGLQEYFQAFETQKKGLFQDLAQTFLDGLSVPVYPLEEYGKFWGEEENFRTFLTTLVETVQERSKKTQKYPLEFQEKLFKLVQESKIRRESYNLSAPILIETLFYQARGIA